MEWITAQHIEATAPSVATMEAGYVGRTGRGLRCDLSLGNERYCRQAGGVAWANSKESCCFDIRVT